MSVVLVVEPDESRRERLGRWLEDEGHEVLACPGPRVPVYVCVGGIRRRCPLAEGADVVLLDLELDSDVAMTGTSSEELLACYHEAGLPVLAFAHDPDPRVMYPADMRRIEWPPDRRTVVSAVDDATR